MRGISGSGGGSGAVGEGHQRQGGDQWQGRGINGRGSVAGEGDQGQGRGISGREGISGRGGTLVVGERDQC